MQLVIEANKDEWTFEYEYWQKRDNADEAADRPG